MEKSIVHKFYQFIAVLALAVLLGGRAQADTITLHTLDGSSISGEMVSSDDKGFVLKQADGTYGDHVPWGKLTQADLKELQQNPKLKDFVEPFIEITQADKMKRSEVPILNEVPHLPRPTERSLIGAIFGSGIGLFMLVVVYAGNIYAGYEVSLFRGKSPALVCGVSAVAPVIGPIIFLSMAPKLEDHKAADWGPSADAVAAAEAAAAALSAEMANPGEAAEQAEAAAPVKAALPPTKVFTRGQTTFNRRFFETNLSKYAALVRPEELRGMVLTVKSARGTYEALRISQIGQSDVQLQVQQGSAFHDVTVPYPEIQEIQLKHQDA